MAQYYDDGGAIDTDDDNSGAAPVSVAGGNGVEDDSSGVNEAIQTQQAPQQEQQNLDTQSGNAMGGGNAKRIISYLMGEGGVSPQQLDQAGRQVDPQGQLDPGSRNLLAIEAANRSGGLKAAWPLMQGNRIAFNGKQAFGEAAITGNQQKPPDLNAAIDAANQAEQHVLDGSSVRFAPSQGGVTATVKVAGSSQPQQINLTTDQFKQYLQVGGDGQWDKLMEHTVPATLQRLAQSTSFGQGYDPASQAARPAQPQQPQPAKSNFGKTPSTLNLSGDDNVQPPAEDNSGIDPELRNKANSLFPAVSQGDERNRFMAGDISRSEELQNRQDVERIKGEFHVQGIDNKGGHDENKAKIYSAGREKAALANLQAHIQAQEAAGTRNARTLQEKALATVLMTGGKLSPQQKAMWDQITTATPEPKAQPQQAPQQQQGASQQPQQLSAQDQQALSWAKANPADPRAVKIKQKLGVQ